MKKFISLTVIVLLFATITLTSCNIQNTAYSILGITRYTVSAEEYYSAFNHVNYTIIYLNDNYKSIMSIDYPYQKLEIYDFTEQSNSVYYLNLQTGCRIYKSNNEWIEDEKIDEDLIKKENQISLNKYKIIGSNNEYDFEDLKFDKSTNSYILSDERYSGYTPTYYYKFENGNLISIEIIINTPSSEEKQIITNIGTTVVDLPEIKN